MINTENYETKEFTPAPSAYAFTPQTRLRRPKQRRYEHTGIAPGDVDFISDFIKVSAFYVEDLEDYLGEELEDFWQSREHALRIITDVMMQQAEAEMA